VRWRDGRESWEEYSSDYGTLTLTLTPTPTPIPTPTRYSADYVEKLSGFDSYVAGVRLAARQGKTPPQRKKPAAEVTVAAAEEDDDNDEQVLPPRPHPHPTHPSGPV